MLAVPTHDYGVEYRSRTEAEWAAVLRAHDISMRPFARALIIACLAAISTLAGGAREVGTALPRAASTPRSQPPRGASESLTRSVEVATTAGCARAFG